MTSRLAFSYNRDVYALPGRVDDICSLGCNELIRCKIAEPLTSVSALLDGLGIVQGGKRRQISENDLIRSIYRDSMDEERLSLLGRLLTLIRSNRGIMLEDLATAAELPYHEAANLCSLMESDGIISIDLLQRCSINAKII